MNKKQSRLISTTLSAAMILNGLASTVHATGVTAHSHLHVLKEEEPVAPAADTAAEQQSVEAQSDEKAVENKKAEKTSSNTIEEEYSPVTVNTDDMDFSSVVSDANAGVAGEAEIDREDPGIQAVEEELENIVVKDEATGEKKGLSEAQKAEVLGMYAQYTQFQKDNADIFGVQTPFFLNYNDSKDDLGVLGEMLCLANVSVDDVRSGNYSYDELTGMISTYIMGDQFALQFYGETIRNQRDSALSYVEKSGAKTEAQKLTVLNDWLTTQASFDMSYIMNMGKDQPDMVAPQPTKHQYYDTIYDAVYAQYEDQITKQFRGQFEEAIIQQLKIQYYQGAIQEILTQGILSQIADDPENPTDEEKAAAQEQAEAQVKADEDKIAQDPEGYLASLSEEAAAAVAAEYEKWIQDVKKNGLDTPNGHTSIDAMVDDLMKSEKIDIDGDNKEDGTAEELIPAIAAQASEQVATAVLGYWKGSHIGALAEGEGVCLAYAKAFAYLVQCMHPEIYTGNKDIKVASNWLEPKDLYYDENGNLDINKNYSVDMVRITFQAQVTMYGETQDDFNSDHFWNAVKVDGQWYYCDPCYTDTFSEVMTRDRVETDGFINHMYHLFSHTSAASLYEGNYSEIKTLYEQAATNKQYEDSWISRAKSFISMKDGNAYYVYNSSNLIKKLDDYNNNQSYEDSEDRIKLVSHDLSKADTADGDSDYVTLIDFNSPIEDNEDGETEVLVRDKDGNMVRNDVLTELYEEHKAMAEIYPSINITSALDGNKVLFNMSKYILSYDLESGEVAIHKSYDEVNGVRDKTKAFGGAAFALATNGGDFTFQNHPIAGMVLKPDGKLHVAIATNLAYISGKDDLTRKTTDGENYTADSPDSYGYEFEETNYNPNYQNYSNSTTNNDQMMEQLGYTKEINDNDEFMWVANLRGEETISSLVSENLEYEPINCDHHWIESNETYFTKADDGSWNTGMSYICVKCAAHVTEPNEPKENSFNSDTYEKQKADYDKKKAYYDEVVASAGHVYNVVDPEWSEDKSTVTIKKLEDPDCTKQIGKLDFFQEADKKMSVDLTEAETFETTAVTTGKCAEGTVTTYTAEGTTKDGYKFKVSVDVENDPGEHPYVQEWTWAEDYSSATVSVECPIDGDKHENVEAATVGKDEEASKPATCLEEGVDVYVASAEIKDEEGNVIQTVTDTKEVVLPKLEHEYEASFEWNEDYSKATAVATCKTGGETLEAVDAVVSKDEEKSKPASCTEDGLDVFNAKATFTDEEGNVIFEADAEPVEVVLPKGQHNITIVIAWDGKNANATADCADCETEFTPEVVVERDAEKSVDPTCQTEGKDVLNATATVKDEEGNVIATNTSTNTVTVPKLKHNLSLENVKFTWDGLTSATAEATCSVGGETLTADCVISKDTEKSVEPTATTEGKYVWVATAVFEDADGEKIATFTDEKEEVVAAVSHELSYKWTWTDDHKATVTATCTLHEGETFNAEGTVSKVDAESIEPTCQQEGKDVYQASARVLDENGDLIGTPTDKHEYAVAKSAHTPEITITWDGANATATAKCSECGTEMGTVVKVVRDEENSIQATCEAEGQDVYIATATVLDADGNSIAEKQDTNSVTVAKLKHNLSLENVKFEWNGYESATAEAACSVCGEVIKAAEVTVVKDDKKSEAPTATTEGKNVYVATAVFKDGEETIATFTDEKTEVLSQNEVTAMYRLYNPNSGEHFYTANPSEKQMLVDKGWTFESIGWYAPVESNTPVYRLYNPNAGDHHYTKEAGERDILVSKGWTYERIGWYSCDEEEVPLYRQYNPNAKEAGAHNYTTNKAENDYLVSLGWRAEGIGWYGCKN